MDDALVNQNRAHRTLSMQRFRDLRDLIYEKSGLFFPEAKLYLLEGRLNKRLIELELDSFDDYVSLLKRMPNQNEELGKIYNLITINETYFFRYGKQLDVFAKKLFPELLQQRLKTGRRDVKIWSAASSSGEELYTLAILMNEHLNSQIGQWRIDLKGTDISQRILEKAGTGIYTTNSFRGGTTPYYLNRYFTSVSGGYQIKNEIKQMVKFEYLNLNDAAAIRQQRGVDFLFCRNVLIYFDLEVKKKVVRSFYDVINHGGYLFLGEAESLHGISSSFKVEHFPGSFIYKKE